MIKLKRNNSILYITCHWRGKRIGPWDFCLIILLIYSWKNMGIYFAVGSCISSLEAGIVSLVPSLHYSIIHSSNTTIFQCRSKTQDKSTSNCLPVWVLCTNLKTPWIGLSMVWLLCMAWMARLLCTVSYVENCKKCSDLIGQNFLLF